MSGITGPGVTVFFVPVTNSVPQISDIELRPFARLEYNDINASVDASIPSDFIFPNNIQVATGTQWAIITKYDGNEMFTTWKDKIGDPIIGTNTTSAGPSGNFIGQFYNYISSVPVAAAAPFNQSSGIVSLISYGANTSTASSDYTDGAWRPSNDTNLKFQIFAARFAVFGNTNLVTYFGGSNTSVPTPAGIHNSNGVITQNTSTGVVSFTVPPDPYEFIIYNRRYSVPGPVVVGERAWQKRPYIGNPAPLTVSVINNSTTVTSSTVNFNNYFFLGSNPEYIIMVSENHDGPGLHRHIPRKVLAVTANSTIQLDEACSFNNTAAYFYKSAVAICDRVKPTYAFGTDEDVVVLRGSNANSSLRFQNNCIEAITMTANGGGYSNSDYILITGYEYVANAVTGGANAYANIVTNSSGNVTAIYITNTGCGFVNSAAIVVKVANSIGGNSAGSGLVTNLTVDTTVVTEYQWNGQKGFFKNCRITNPEIGDVIPSNFVSNPLGTFYTISHRLQFYVKPDPLTFAGLSYHKDATLAENDFYLMKPSTSVNFKHTKRRVQMSWSNEIVTDNTATSAGYSSVVVNAVSNSDYLCCCVDDGTLEFTNYIINNDYTLENTNKGNAMAKGITTKVNFANNTFAEDALGYLTLYRPPNTDVKLFMRVQNSHDPEPFDTKDWTMLQVLSGNALYSSQTNESDFIEMSFGFQNCPNTAFRLAGSGTTVLNQTNVVGYGTTWSSNASANLHSGDMVRVSQPLFPNNAMICLVSSVANDTFITLDTPVSNNGLVGSGLNIDKIAFPHQAFLNPMNSNVVRYYANNYAIFDTFDTMQMKVVMLSSDNQNIPRVKSIRVAGVSI